MSESKHTPLPWKFTPWHVEEDAASVRAPEGWAICFTSSDANAEFIVEACNSYYETQATLAAKDAEIKELRAKLFPYADATEISGISWDGKYLIGDKDSIKFFHEMKNRGEQIDVYKRAYDQNIAAKDAEFDLVRRDRDRLHVECSGHMADIKKMREALEGICHFSDALDFRNDHLSKALAQWIEAGRAALKEKAE